MSLIAGLLIACVGVAIIMASASLTKTLWRRERAESHLWGTVSWYILIGFVVIVIGVMVIFGGQVVRPDPTNLKLHQ